MAHGAGHDCRSRHGAHGHRRVAGRAWTGRAGKHRPPAEARRPLPQTLRKEIGRRERRAVASRVCPTGRGAQPRDEPTEMDTGERPGKQHRRPPRPTGRRPLPASLPRQRIEIDVPDADKVCACGTAKTRIGETVSEKLDYVPASVRVMETVRPKYACPQCHEGVTVAPAPPQAVERSLASEGLLALRRRLEVSRSSAALSPRADLSARASRPVAGDALRVGGGRGDGAHADRRGVAAPGDGPRAISKPMTRRSRFSRTRAAARAGSGPISIR